MQIGIRIDSEVTIWTPGHDVPTLTIREDQTVRIDVICERDNSSSSPRVFVEDYELLLHRDMDYDDLGKVSFSSISGRHFRDVFGSAVIRIVRAEAIYELVVEVLATKLHAAQTEAMIRYLVRRREHVIRVCLSRTRHHTGNREGGVADPETVMDSAERLLSLMMEGRQELRQQLRSRLVPVKMPAWKAELSGRDIDPVDILHSLDSIQPVEGMDDLRIRGRAYSIHGIDVSSLIEDANVEENIILIGALYSIRRVIEDLLQDASRGFRGRNLGSHDKEYVSLGEFLLRLTGGALHLRCERILHLAEMMIKSLESEFRIAYQGEIRPRITPYVRSSRIYRVLFEQINIWYDLGTPTLEGTLFLVKLRSIAKIFEFFSLFRLFDYLEATSWAIESASFESEFGYDIPSGMVFRRGDHQLTLGYEEQINTYSRVSADGSLVKLRHPEHPGAYWTPDYVLTFVNQKNNRIRYVILDAKYSTHSVVKNLHLPKLHNKYYEHTAVYDAEKNRLSRDPIVAVMALFPRNTDREPGPVSYRWAAHSLASSGPLMLPMVAGLQISLDEGQEVEDWLSRVVKVVIEDLDAGLVAV